MYIKQLNCKFKDMAFPILKRKYIGFSESFIDMTTYES